MEMSHETLQDEAGNPIDGIEFDGGRFDSMAVIQDDDYPTDLLIRAKRNDGLVIECAAEIQETQYQGIELIEGFEIPVEMQLGLQQIGYTVEHPVGDSD
jgi:hypothetical protein